MSKFQSMKKSLRKVNEQFRNRILEDQILPSAESFDYSILNYHRKGDTAVTLFNRILSCPSFKLCFGHRNNSSN